MSIPSRSAARRLALARVISLTGSQAAFTALLFLVFERTGSAAWVSAGLLLTLGTQGVMTLLLGPLGDRFDRRRIMVASDLLGAACFAALALVAVEGSPGALLAFAFFAAAAESAFLPASSGAIPNLVAPADLAWANGTVALGTNAGYLLGPALGGALVATIGGPAVFAANAVSFLVSAALVVTVRGRFNREREDAGGHRGVRAGFRFVLTDPVLRRMTLAFPVFAVCVGSVLVAELPLATSFGVGSFGYGLIASTFGVGAMAGSLAGRGLTRRTEPRALVLGSVVTAVAFASVGMAASFWVVLAAMLLAGTSDGLVDVAVETTFQRRSPDAVRSRSLAALESIWLTSVSVSFLFSGALVDALGPKAAYVLAGSGCAVTALLLVPLLRLWTEHEPLPAGDATGPESGARAPGF